MADPVVVQSFSVNDGTYAGAFDDDVSIGNSIVIVATGHGDAPQDKHDPLYDGSAVDNATQAVWSNSTGPESETDSGSATSSIWLLPNVQTSGTTVKITDDHATNFYVGIFVYEVANLGTSPVIVQSAKNAGGDGVDQGVDAADTSAAAGNIVFASLVQDGAIDSNFLLGAPWVSAGLDGNAPGYNSSAAYMITSEAGQTLSYLGNGDGGATWSAVIAEIAPGDGSVSASGAITLKKMSVAAAVNAPSGLFNLFSNINVSGLACSPDANGYTLGTEFEVTTDGCSLKGVRFFSASGAIELPQQIGLYNVSGETLIQSQDASWDGDPATGWVTALFDTPIVLDPTAKYVLTAMQTEAVIWYTSGNHFWDTGLGSSGITNGPLSAPNLSASAGGQGLYDYASIPDMGFPTNNYQGSTYWVDPVVDGPGTPSSPSESSVLSIFGGNLPDISVSAANDSPYNIGIQFIVTEDGCELAGYSWYVPDDGDVNGSDYDFALYTTTDGASGTIVDGSTVTGSGTWLTGTWNYTELETPVPLSTGVTYVAVGEIISVSGNTYQAVPDFWDTGAGASGIIAGPLTAPEASTAVGGYQQPYATSHVFPTLSYENSWYGIDVGVTQSSDVSITGAIKLKKMVLSGVGVAPDIYVIQTMRSVGGTYSATFDDPISEHSTILICATGYTGDSITPVSSDPKLDDVFVSDAVQIIPDFWNASCGGTVWMLPDVEAGSPVISLDTNFSNNTENGAFFYEIANLGPNPQLDQFIVSNPHTGDSASFSISPITNRPEFVLGMYIQDGGNPPSGPGDGWNNSGLQGNWGGANNGSGFYQIADTAGAEYSMAWTNDGVVNWSGVILSLMQGGPSASITGAIKLKKMVLSGASTEKAVVTGAINLKKMKVAGSGIVWTAPYVAYAFDEGSGSSIIDYSGNSRNLTISGSNSWVTGQGSYAKAFQSGLAASAGAAWVNGSYLPALTGDVTVQAWYKYTDTDVPTGATRMHIGGLYSTSGTARLALWGYRSLSGVASAPNATVRDSASTIIGAGANGSVAEDNNWHNAACVYHASGLIEVYLDGTKVSSATPTSLPIGNNVLDIAVGSSYSGTPVDQCPVQDMRVFAGALNAAEVVHWMNTPVHPTADLITATITLKKMVLSGASIEKAVITGAIKLKKMVLSGASAEKSVVTSGIKLKKMVLAATVAKKPAITGVISLKKFVISGSSHEKAIITGTITLKKMRVHGEEAKRKASTLFVFWPL